MVTYIPGTPPENAADLRRFLFDEFKKIAASVNSQPVIEQVFKEPEKPREGLLAYADGTHWNPGSGKGLYQRRGNVWALIG